MGGGFTERKKGTCTGGELTEVDHKALIEALDEPLKQAVYGKGNIPSAASEAIRHLSCTYTPELEVE